MRQVYVRKLQPTKEKYDANFVVGIVVQTLRHSIDQTSFLRDTIGCAGPLRG